MPQPPATHTEETSAGAVGGGRSQRRVDEPIPVAGGLISSM
jgi:hypothetical protein